MVEVYVGNHRHARHGNVGGVEPSAHSDFEHREIHLMTCEIEKSGGGKKLKKTRPLGERSLGLKAFHAFPNTAKSRGEIGIGNRPAIDPNPFIGPD